MPQDEYPYRPRGWWGFGALFAVVGIMGGLIVLRNGDSRGVPLVLSGIASVGILAWGFVSEWRKWRKRR